MNTVAAPSSSGPACAGTSSRGACAPAAGDAASGADFAALLMAAAPVEGSVDPAAPADSASLAETSLDTAGAVSPDAAADPAADAAAASSPTEASWLAHLLLPADAAVPRTTPNADTAALERAAADAARPTSTGPAAPGEALRLPGGGVDPASAGRAASPPVDATADATSLASPQGPATGESRAARFADLLATADARGSAVPAMEPTAVTPAQMPAGALMPGPAGVTSITPGTAAGTPSLPLAAPFGSPEFAPALGAQVSVLARDGVQRAELRLNPADMGPIAVQIALDGAQATVHFSADVAATRAALESSWPELAGALRDAGLTLAGGGVSEQPRQRRDGAGDGATGSRADGRAEGSGDRASGDTATAPLPRPRTRGVVDLIA